MENSKYQDRLRKHKTPYNPSAWNQMELMLDNLDYKKNRRKGGWWWFGLFFLIGISFAGIAFHYMNHSPDQEKITDIEENEIINDSNQRTFSETSSEIETTNKDIVVNNESPVKEIKTNPSKPQNSKTAGSQENVNNLQFKNEYKPGIPPAKAQDLIASSESISEDSLHKEKINASAEEKDNKLASDQNNNSLPFPIEDQQKSSLDSIDAISQVAVLPLRIMADSLLENTYQWKRPSKFYYLLDAGYAYLNDYPGFTVGTGIHWEIDKLLHLGVQVRYGYGSGINTNNNSRKEQQADLAMNVHLLLYNSSDHFLSLAPGIGYAYFHQQEKRDDNEKVILKSYGGRSFNGSIHYRYKINPGSRIGLSGGVISFDDALVYLSFNYLKRF